MIYNIVSKYKTIVFYTLYAFAVKTTWTSSSLIWNTISGEETDFCTHISDRESVHYQVWFQRFIELSASMTHSMNLYAWPVANVIILKPSALYCRANQFYLVIQTHHNSDELKALLKHFAIHVTEQFNLFVPETIISVVLHLHQRNEPFKNYRQQGIYIMQKEEAQQQDEQQEHQHNMQANQQDRQTRAQTRMAIPQDNDVSLHDKNVIHQLAQRRQIVISDIWKAHNCIYIALENFAALNNNSLDRFKIELQNRMTMRIQIVV